MGCSVEWGAEVRCGGVGYVGMVVRWVQSWGLGSYVGWDGLWGEV